MSHVSAGGGPVQDLQVRNARVPRNLIVGEEPFLSGPGDGYALIDIGVRNGFITQLSPSGGGTTDASYVLDARGGMVLPCYVDVHTHLDKTQTFHRVVNSNGTLQGAICAEHEDMALHWNLQDVKSRMHFGVACAYAHGTSAMRSHLLSHEQWRETIWQAFAEVQHVWRGKVKLQPAALVNFDLLRDPLELDRLADWVLAHGGVLGCAIMNPAGDIAAALDRMLRVADERGLDLDFHADENEDPESRSLRDIAESVQRTSYSGRVVVGHCCSLALQSTETVQETLARVRESNIGVVALPLTNAFLQGRAPGVTPTVRGITRLREMHRAGVVTALASDNCRDPFFPFGDYDMQEVLASGVLMAHLEQELLQACAAVTRNPAQMMRLDSFGVLSEGAGADLLIYGEQDLAALIARRPSPTHLIRNGIEAFPKLPDFGMLHRPVNKDKGE